MLLFWPCQEFPLRDPGLWFLLTPVESFLYGW